MQSKAPMARSRAQAAPEQVETFHLSPSVAGAVRGWYCTDGVEAVRDGERSAYFAHPDDPGRAIKIKGAGLNGGPIRFGTTHASRLKAPIFDFDGRMMEDVASGHDSAWLGGATFQQVVIEHRVTEVLEALGIPVVPCLGYGYVRNAAQRSWFSVFDWNPEWIAVRPPAVGLEEMAEASERRSRLIVELACRHDLIGYCWYMADREGNYLVKDLHPFRQADPVNMSQLSWVMQVLFALHIPTLSTMAFARRYGDGSALPDNYQARGFRGALADATDAEHEELRWTIVAPYMLKPPAEFDPGALHAALARNRIASALLELCPPKYVRY